MTLAQPIPSSTQGGGRVTRFRPERLGTRVNTEQHLLESRLGPDDIQGRTVRQPLDVDQAGLIGLFEQRERAQRVPDRCLELC